MNNNTTSVGKSNRKRNRYSKYKIYLPENLNIDEVLINNPPAFKRMPTLHRNLRDKMAYILHLISAIPHANKDFDIEKEKGFTPVNKAILQKKIHDYKDYIEYLESQGIIKAGSGYNVGKKSTGLKFQPKYRTKLKADYITTQSLIKSIVTKRPKRDIKAEEKLSFFKMFLNSDLTIDHNRALFILEEDKELAKTKLIRKRKSKKYTQKELENLPTIDDAVLLGFNSKWITVEKIHTADYADYPFIDGTTGRLHSPFVVLYKKLRHLLRYKNMPLANVDIVNSQPFLSLILLDSELFERLNIDKLIAKYNPWFRETYNVDETGKIVSINPNNYSTMLVKMIKEAEEKADVINFRKSVIDGTYYEYFADLLIKGDLVPDYILNNSDDNERYSALRKFAKTATFRAFFDNVYAKKWSKEVKTFAECFPNVYRIFLYVKKGYHYENQKKQNKIIKVKVGNYNTLACVLQKLESYLVLHNVCVDINEHHPDVPLFTIHDSIATTKPNVELVKYYFQKHVKKIMGIEPNLSTETWE